MGEFVHQFTYEQMGLVCAAAACCFTALSTLLVNLRDEELCGLLYDTRECLGLVETLWQLRAVGK